MKNQYAFKTTEHKYQFATILNHHFDIIDSTQFEARRKIDSVDNNNWLLFSANSQTSGIGQHEREWVSPAAVNVYATYAFPIPSSRQANLIHIPQRIGSNGMDLPYIQDR